MQKSTWQSFPSFTSYFLWRCTVPCLSFSSICLSISSCPLSSLLSICLSSRPFYHPSFRLLSFLSLPSVYSFLPPLIHSTFRLFLSFLFHLYPVFPFLISSLLVSFPYPYLSPLSHPLHTSSFSLISLPPVPPPFPSFPPSRLISLFLSFLSLSSVNAFFPISFTFHLVFPSYPSTFSSIFLSHLISFLLSLPSLHHAPGCWGRWCGGAEEGCRRCRGAGTCGSRLS